MMRFCSRKLISGTAVAESYPDCSSKELDDLLLATRQLCGVIMLQHDSENRLNLLELHFVQTPLKLVLHALRKIIQAPGVFKDPAAKREFVQDVHHTVTLALGTLELTQKFEADIEALARQRAEKVFGYPLSDDAFEGKMHWPPWTGNALCIGSDDMRKAIIGKKDWKVASQYLPRGGTSLLHAWTEDVDEIVTSLLEVCHGRNLVSVGLC